MVLTEIYEGVDIETVKSNAVGHLSIAKSLKKVSDPSDEVLHFFAIS